MIMVKVVMVVVCIYVFSIGHSLALPPSSTLIHCQFVCLLRQCIYVAYVVWMNGRNKFISKSVLFAHLSTIQLTDDCFGHSFYSVGFLDRWMTITSLVVILIFFWFLWNILTVDWCLVLDCSAPKLKQREFFAKHCMFMCDHRLHWFFPVMSNS